MSDDPWAYDEFAWGSAHGRDGGPRRAAGHDESVRRAWIVYAGDRQAAESPSVAAGAGGGALAVALAVVLFVFGSLGMLFHVVHREAGHTGSLASWAYWLAGATLAVGAFQWWRPKRVANLALLATVVLFAGTCSDGVGFHRRALPAAEEPTLAKAFAPEGSLLGPYHR